MEIEDDPAWASFRGAYRGVGSDSAKTVEAGAGQRVAVADDEPFCDYLYCWPAFDLMGDPGQSKIELSTHKRCRRFPNHPQLASIHTSSDDSYVERAREVLAEDGEVAEVHVTVVVQVGIHVARAVRGGRLERAAEALAEHREV